MLYLEDFQWRKRGVSQSAENPAKLQRIVLVAEFIMRHYKLGRDAWLCHFIPQKILDKISSFLGVYEWIKRALTETKAGIHGRFLFQNRLKLRLNMLIRLCDWLI